MLPNHQITQTQSHRPQFGQNNAGQTGASQHVPTDVLSSATYLMSSVGQVADDPSGVCIYEMREFMNEPGASKQISSQ